MYSLSMRKDKGFTLIELMVVIAIMAIVSAIAVPNFYSYAAGMKLRSASRDLYSALQKTRMNAIRDNRRWSVALTATSYTVVDCGPDNDCSANNLNPQTTNLSQYAGISITGGVPITFIFNSEGTCNAGTIEFTSPSGTSRVEVLPTGRIKIL